MKKGNNYLLLIFLLILALPLVGCGGGNESESLQDTDHSSSESASAETENTSEEESAVAAVASTGDAANGQTLYQQSCTACHGEGAKGVPGLGKDMTTSTFIKGLSDDELQAFIKEGRAVDHPDNTTGVAMPAKGGNPSLTDEQLLDIIAYIRTLEQ